MGKQKQIKFVIIYILFKKKKKENTPPPPRKKNQQIRQHLFKRVTDWEVNINDVNPYVMYIAKKKMSTSVVKAANNNK